ncbi:LacI family DNA-binding transcriptional regulator [Isoptericola cucumis]|uniref:LacI family transcriptional regulator n=1 Tax=Isoptericola cucumis TaxID=1776856 RepID=A0ABQ2B823_9MICO|nr:LacI family DNA-binding transcriptional regulator [Isoptericola cucumis]GGI08916.1 LacI family transcriptional regulator [Isoptericola cucumis]
MARITIADIARRAGVSTGAVSYALNDRPGVSKETRERILSIAAELGWAPSQAARSLSGARAETVGLILARDPHTLGYESFYMQFVAGIESELATRSYGLLLQVVEDLDAEVQAYRRWRAARRVDGVVVVDPRAVDPRVELLAERDALPAVVVGDPSLAGGLTSVWTDDAAAMRESVRYLADLGHTRIGRVSGVEDFGHTHIRDVAFTDEATSRGVQAVVRRTDFSPERGAEATRRFLDGPDAVTAIVYDNDVMALAGLGAAHEVGVRVPQDVSLVAWDDSPLCLAAFPQLTALSHDVTSYGAHVARRLFERMGGARPGSYLDSTPTLKVRGTTAPPAR